MIDVTDFDVQSWVITPAAKLAGDTSKVQQWLVVLTGVANINWKAGALLNGQEGWQDQNYRILMDWQSPTYWAKGQPSPPVEHFFQAEQWAPYATFNSVLAAHHGDTFAGFAVNTWRMGLVERRAKDGSLYRNIVRGLEIDVSVRDSSLIA
ncbi:MAG TPA: hypothetical protein VFQ61_38485, partial [Polyangiaceae bacterium]|nr:hypothetical protein [Polyangiaceae bacterium]